MLRNVQLPKTIIDTEEMGKGAESRIDSLLKGRRTHFIPLYMHQEYPGVKSLPNPTTTIPKAEHDNPNRVSVMSKPTVRKAEFPSGCRRSQEANASSRKATRNSKRKWIPLVTAREIQCWEKLVSTKPVNTIAGKANNSTADYPHDTGRCAKTGSFCKDTNSGSCFRSHRGFSNTAPDHSSRRSFRKLLLLTNRHGLNIRVIHTDSFHYPCQNFLCANRENRVKRKDKRRNKESKTAPWEGAHTNNRLDRVIPKVKAC